MANEWGSFDLERSWIGTYSGILTEDCICGDETFWDFAYYPGIVWLLYNESIGVRRQSIQNSRYH